MKRKLALLLAAVMMLSLLPMNVYAASENRFSKAPSVMPEGTVLYEDGWQNTGVQLLEFAEKKPAADIGDGVEYYVDGTDLLIFADNDVQVGGSFRLRLEGAEWFFRHVSSSGQVLDKNGTVLEDWDLNNDNNLDVLLRLKQLNRSNGVLSGLINNLNTSGGGINVGFKGVNMSVTGVSMGVAAFLDDGTTEVKSFDFGTSNERWDEKRIGGVSSRPIEQPKNITYNPKKGAYFPDNVGDNYGRYGRSGTYIRTRYGESTDYKGTYEIPYKLQVSSLDARDAIVTILYRQNDDDDYRYDDEMEDYLGPSNMMGDGGVRGYYYPRNVDGVNGSTSKTPLIRIPLVSRTTGQTDVRVSIMESNLTSVTNNTYLYGNVGASNTNTYVLNPETSRTDFVWDQLIIRETRIGSIKNNDPNERWAWKTGTAGTYADLINALDRYFREMIDNKGPIYDSTTGTQASDVLDLTSADWMAGYYDPYATKDDLGWGEHFSITLPTGFEFNMNLADVRLGVESGLEWREAGRSKVGNIDWPLTGLRKYNEVPATQGYPNFLLQFGEDGRGNVDRSVLRVWLYGVRPSTQIVGALYFEGIEFAAHDNSKFGDFDAVINRGSKDGDLGITSQTFKAGTRADWTILLKAISEIPTLVNGRYDGPTYMTAKDDVHKTAKVQFGENSVNAWWAERDTIFYLPEGVKFRRVEVTAAENFADQPYKDESRIDRNYNRNPLDEDYEYGAGIYIGDGEKRGAVTIDGSEMTWTNLAIRHNKKGLVEMDIWVSIRSGFEDDVTLGVRGSAVPDQPGEVPPIVIARSVSPITVDTRVTDILIGYQDQKTSDVIIKETAAGMLQRNKEVLLSITDMISADMLLSPTTQVNVTEGDIKLKDVGLVGGSSNFGINPFTGKANTDLGTTGGTIAFSVDRSSTVASTITLNNVAVKIDRTVPLTNDRPYKVVVWGDAVAANFGSAHNDMFPAKWAGVMADYIAVVSSAEDEPSVLTNEVWVTIGDTYYIVNGKSVDMDAAAYISPSSNSTMVPLRFLSEALGIADENILWIDNGPDNKKVVINTPNKTLAFTIGDPNLVSNGVSIPMLSPDKLPVAPEIKGDRTYVPFRAVGEAFGVPVTWDKTTQTAKYNEGRYVG